MSNLKRKQKEKTVSQKEDYSNCLYVKPVDFLKLVREFLTPGTQKYEDLLFLAEKKKVHKEVLVLVTLLKKKAKLKKFTTEDIEEVNNIMGELDALFIDADLPDNY